MRFYKGIRFLTDPMKGEPVPVGFERKEKSGNLFKKLGREGHRLAEQADMPAGYSTEQLQARTMLQTYCSQRNDIGKIGFYNNYEEAKNQPFDLDLMKGYLAFLNSVTPNDTAQIADVKKIINDLEPPAPNQPPPVPSRDNKPKY